MFKLKDHNTVKEGQEKLQEASKTYSLIKMKEEDAK